MIIIWCFVLEFRGMDVSPCILYIYIYFPRRVFTFVPRAWLEGAVVQNFTRQELRAGVALAAQWFPEQVTFGQLTSASLGYGFLSRKCWTSCCVDDFPSNCRPPPKKNGSRKYSGGFGSECFEFSSDFFPHPVRGEKQKNILKLGNHRPLLAVRCWRMFLPLFFGRLGRHLVWSSMRVWSWNWWCKMISMIWTRTSRGFLVGMMCVEGPKMTGLGKGKAPKKTWLDFWYPC